MSINSSTKYAHIMVKATGCDVIHALHLVINEVVFSRAKLLTIFLPKRGRRLQAYLVATVQGNAGCIFNYYMIDCL